MKADNAHLPTVSVFIVLLAMMAALTSYTVPSKNNFKAAKLSLFDSFSNPDSAANAKKKQLPVWLTQELQQLCNEFSAECKAIETDKAQGFAILFEPDAYDATLSGLSPKEQKFLKELATICAGKALRLTMSLPLQSRLDTANILVLFDLLKDSSGALKLAVVQAPSLQDTPSIGFLVTPQVPAS